MRFFEAFRYYRSIVGMSGALLMVALPRIGGKLFGEPSYFKCVQLWLRLHFMHIVNQYKNSTIQSNRLSPSDLIWVFWWQGYNNMPEIIKNCYKSVCRNSNGHQVVLLSKDNIREYVDLPDYIWDKFNAKKIAFPHLSDLIRLKILYTMGGVWIDAAVFVIKPIYIDGKIFITPKLSKTLDCHMMGKWTIGVMGSYKHCSLFSFAYDCLLYYWKRYDTMFDYLLFDAIIRLGYEQLTFVKQLIDDNPPNSENIHDTRYLFPKELDKDKFESIIENNTFISLTYRIDYPKRLPNGKLTYYGALLERFPSR